MNQELPYYYLFLALLLPLLLLLKFKPHKHGQRLPPGPWQLPVIGSLHHLLGALPHRAMSHLSRRHGPLMLLRLGEVAVVVVSSPEAAREVMKTHDIVFATRPQTATIRTLTKEGQGIALTPYGDHWRQLRKICITELLSARRVQSFRHVREEEAARLVRSIAASSPSQLVNVSKLLTTYVIDSVVRAVMGDKIRDRDAFLEKLDEGVRVAAGFSLADIFPSSRLARVLSGTARKAETHHRAMTRLMDGIIAEHQGRRAAGAGDEEDLMDVLLRIQKKGGLQFPLSMRTIRAVIIDLFSAGSETSATTLQWAMAELIRNPRAMHKAQAEVRDALAGQARGVTEEALGELHYLQLVIKETLRLHPPVPLLLPRECQEACQIIGYDVPKGAMVLVNAWAIGRDPEHWDDAEEFKPERFVGSSVDFKGADFEFIPFGAGRRICPGISFGVAGVQLALANLLFYFDWELPAGIIPGELDMTESLGITARRVSDLWLRPVICVPLPTA